MKRMSTKQKNRNNVISAKRMAKNKRRKPHVKKIMLALERIKVSERRIENAQRKMIKLAKQAQVAKSQGKAL